MADENAVGGADMSSAQPIVHSIGPGDLRDALVKGIADFEAMPTHLVFLCVIYPLLMLIVARIFAGYDVLPLVFPLIAGYTLIGPLVATGMYELSRRREQGLDISREDQRQHIVSTKPARCIQHRQRERRAPPKA